MEDLTFEEWTRLLASSDPGDRSHAADSPPKGRRKEVVRRLVKCLRDSDPLVRTCAADSLGLYNTGEARVALRAHLRRETDELARAYALSSLGAVGRLEDVVTLAQALKVETNPHVRLDAALGLAFCIQGVCFPYWLKVIREDEQHCGAASNVAREYLSSHTAYVKLLRRTVLRKPHSESMAMLARESLANLVAFIDAKYKFD